MLIPSNRHTKEDLRLWAEYEEADRVHGETLDCKIDRAMKVIVQFTKQPSFCSVSWGKDSIVVAHMTNIVAPKTPLVWVSIIGKENPDCRSVMSAFCWPCHVIEAEPGIKRTSERGFREARATFGNSISGIRSAESGDRRLSRLVHGVSTSRTCRPIIDWSYQDVMGYIARFNLPAHPAYAMLGGGRYDREWIRVGALGGERGRGMDRGAWEQEYYGDVLARMQLIKHDETTR